MTSNVLGLLGLTIHPSLYMCVNAKMCVRSIKSQQDPSSRDRSWVSRQGDQGLAVGRDFLSKRYQPHPSLPCHAMNHHSYMSMSQPLLGTCKLHIHCRQEGLS
jgi:hypothetical protein